MLVEQQQHGLNFYLHILYWVSKTQVVLNLHILRTISTNPLPHEQQINSRSSANRIYRQAYSNIFRATLPKDIVFYLWHNLEVKVVSAVRNILIFLHVFTVHNFIVMDYSFTPMVSTLPYSWYLVVSAVKTFQVAQKHL